MMQVIFGATAANSNDALLNFLNKHLKNDQVDVFLYQLTNQHYKLSRKQYANVRAALVDWLANQFAGLGMDVSQVELEILDKRLADVATTIAQDFCKQSGMPVDELLSSLGVISN